MAVRSQRLGANLGVGTTETTLYTVPSGFRTIVKSIVVCNRNAAANFFALGLYSGGSEVAIWREFMAASGNAGDTVFRDLWVVMDAFDHITGTAHLSPVSVVISGAELDLP